ncbi:MAG: GAF and ANTAR domain-containing protein [Arthrobacter sp.]
MSKIFNSDPVDQLQDILAGTEDAVEFLSGLSKLAAAAVSEAAGDDVECAVTVKVSGRTATAAGSGQRALELDRLEQAVGDGPCIAALRQMSPVVIDDVSSDVRWPELNQKFAAAGVYSSIGVPLEIGGEAAAALNFFASRPGVFTPDVYDKAAGFAAAAHNTLHLSVRIDTAQNRGDNLEAAMRDQTVINLACGMIMAQRRCPQAEAMEILVKVASERKRELRDVASELVEQLSTGNVQTHFDS